MRRNPENQTTPRTVKVFLAALALLVCSVPAQAGLITTVIDENNDCAGFFGSSFPECNVFGLSPVIAKFSAAAIAAENGPATEINSGLFPSVTGLEWDFAGTPAGGTWSYNPGVGDPAILFYTVKAANQFSLNYLVPDVSQAACTLDPLSIGCLQSAIAFPTSTAVSWATATGQNVSHLTFYDSGSADENQVPEPGTMLLLALGCLALTKGRRRTP